MFNSMTAYGWHILSAAAGAIGGAAMAVWIPRACCKSSTKHQDRCGEELKASNGRQALALGALREGIWDWDIVKNTLIYDARWTNMLGLPPTTEAQSPVVWQDRVHPRDRQQAAAKLAAHFRGETATLDNELRLRHADGHYIWVSDRGKVVTRAADGTPVRMIGTHREITQRKEAELALALHTKIADTFLTSEPALVYRNLLSSVCDAFESPLAILFTTEGGTSLRMTAYDVDRPADPDALSLNTTVDLVPPVLEACRANGGPQTSNHSVTDKLLGCTFTHHLAAPLTGTQGQTMGYLMVCNRNLDYLAADTRAMASLVAFLAPILEFKMAREHSEHKHRQAIKMEATDALAGGIAHDFNNTLQAILGFTNLARDDALTIDSETGASIASDLDRVIQATQHGHDLAKRMLMFSRRLTQDRIAVDLSAEVKQCLAEIPEAAPSDITVQSNLTNDCQSVRGDRGQICEMVRSLLTNSVQAMEDGGGKLQVTVRNHAAYSASPLIPPTMTNLDLVQLTVSDSGRGMSKTTQARAFDPFFTTRPVGEGTGLGLAVVQGIVAAHEGEITIISVIGQGTQVHVFLPSQARKQA